MYKCIVSRQHKPTVKTKYDQENTPEIGATLIRRSHLDYSSTLYLNVYENHFVY